jgi:hypothetical protein
LKKYIFKLLFISINEIISKNLTITNLKKINQKILNIEFKTITKLLSTRLELFVKILEID